jgi:hypothetical protein
MPTPAEMQELRRLAILEMKNPTGAYDVFKFGGSDPPNKGKNHPLAWLVQDKEPPMRHRHPLLARDQAEMPVRGATSYGGMDQDPDDDDDDDDDDDTDGPVSLSAADCYTLLMKCVANLQGQEKDAFLEQVANYFQSPDDPGNGVTPTNTNAMDRRRRKGARDGLGSAAVNAVNTANRAATGGKVFDRKRPGMDANISNRLLNASNFTKKWGKLTNHISVR